MPLLDQSTRCHPFGPFRPGGVLDRPRVMKSTLLAPLAAALVAASSLLSLGCAGPDITIPNPVVSGAVSPNHIIKQHGFAESSRGLPVGSMADEAVLESLTAQEVCVSVSLHELSAIDLQTAQIHFADEAGAGLVPAMTVTPATSQSYAGLIPREEQTGTRLVCNTNANGQTVCETQPIIRTVMVPGPVEVFNTKGRLCAPNQNVVTAASKGLALEITTPTAGRSYIGFGHGSKKSSFRWAFAK
jgi:hypothetical protein